MSSLYLLGWHGTGGWNCGLGWVGVCYVTLLVPGKKLSGNTSGEFVMRTDFLPYVLLANPCLPDTSLLAWDK